MRSAIENWYAKVCKISEYSIRYTLKVGLTPWRRPLSAYYVGVDNSSGTEILLYIIPGVFAVLFAKFFVIDNGFDYGIKLLFISERESALALD